MTKSVFVTNLSEIKTIKVTCKSCGFAVIFPTNTEYRKIVQCINCETRFPADETRMLIEAIKHLQTSLTENKDLAHVKVEIETEVK